jgi:hypothetical protein
VHELNVDVRELNVGVRALNVNVRALNVCAVKLNVRVFEPRVPPAVFFRTRQAVLFHQEGIADGRLTRAVTGDKILSCLTWSSSRTFLRRALAAITAPITGTTEQDDLLQGLAAGPLGLTFLPQPLGYLGARGCYRISGSGLRAQPAIDREWAIWGSAPGRVDSP